MQLGTPTHATQALLKVVLTTAREQFDPEVPYKKVGVVVSGLVPKSMAQHSLFTEEEQPTDNSLDEIQDKINHKYGKHTLRYGTLLKSGPRTSHELCSPQYTTAWQDIPRVAVR